MGMIKNRYKVLLAERDLNIKQFAALAGLQYTTARNMVSGETYGVNFRTLEKVCWALQCQPGDIYQYDPTGKRKKG